MWKISVFLKKKKKKQQYGCECYKTEDEKNKLAEYRKNIIEWDKMSYYNLENLLLYVWKVLS